jgi:4-alpha-glucanotransferase
LPNSTSGNWSWRFEDDDLTAAVEQQLRELTKLYGR